MNNPTPMLILIRHAERPDIAADAIGNDVLLTEKGKQDTLQFAKKLKSHVVSIRTSPIKRCLETALIIAEATCGSVAEITHDTDLGDPGFIISDGAEAWRHWQEKGHKTVNQYLLSGAERWEGFADLDRASQCFADKIRSHLSRSQDGLHIWVTHDTILATFASRMLNKPLTLNQWPDFLGHLTVSLVDGDLFFSYQKNPVSF